MGSNPTIHNNIFLQTFPISKLKSTLAPVYPGNETAWILAGPPVDPADLVSRRFIRGGKSVIRLSLGKLRIG